MRSRSGLPGRLAAVAAAGLLALTGCTSPAEDPPADPNALRLQVSGGPDETRVYASIARAFEERNPGVAVEVVPVPGRRDHLARLGASVEAGDPPDVFVLGLREYARFVTQGAVEPVEPYLAAEGVALSRYYQAPVEAFTYDGEVQCMPQDVSPLVVFYNRALFDAAEVDRPRKRWTWTEFARTARRLTGKGVHGVGIDPSLRQVAPFVWSGGGDVVDDLEEPTRLTLSRARARRAVADVVRLVRSKAAPAEDEVTAQSLRDRFAAGTLAMWLSSRREVPALREVGGLEFDVAPLPRLGAPATILHADAYCLARTGERHDLAGRFVAFAVGPTGQSLTALDGRAVPSLRSAAQSPAFVDPGRPPRRSRVFLDAVRDLRRTPVVPAWPEVEDLAEEALTRAFYDRGTSVEALLAELDKQSRAVLARDR